MNVNSRKRPWLAVLLAFVYPGLGHVYLRAWFRALLWFGLVITSSVVLVPDGVQPAGASIDALVQASRQIPLESVLLLFSITVFSMIDAYWVAKQRNQRVDIHQGSTCPNCGKEIDQDIDFCHWCTEPLYETEESADAGR